MRIVVAFFQAAILFSLGYFFIPAFESVLSSDDGRLPLILLYGVATLAFYAAYFFSRNRRTFFLVINSLSATALVFLVQFLITSIPISKPYFALALIVSGLAAYVLAGAMSRTVKREVATSWSGVLVSPITWLPFILLGLLFAGRALQYYPFFGRVLMVTRTALGDWSSNWALVDAFPGLALRQPMNLVPVPGAGSRLFVLERAGVVKEFDAANAQGSRVVLDISDRVTFDPTSEDGAFSLALHPRFGLSEKPGDDFFYIHYTTTVAKMNHNRLSRFDFDRKTGRASAASEKILIEQPHPHSRTHNGGSIEFGRDGFLYLSIGDFSGGIDSLGHSQRVDEGLFSGIIRIDVDRQGGSVSHPIRRHPRSGKTSDYFIPSDNPFVGRSNTLEEYWALGLRNPFRFSFDELTGELWTGDVGQEHFEEINIVTKGSNHQWSYREGLQPFLLSRFRGQRPENMVGVETPPLYTYAHSSTERVIIGGQVYRGEKFQDLKGRYLFVDNASSSLNSLIREAGKEPRVIRLTTARAFERYAIFGVSSLFVDKAGDIFITLMGAASADDGKVLKLVSGSGLSSVRKSVDQRLSVEVLYEMSCARCHGKNGDGKGEALIGKVPRNFRDSDWQSSTSDERIERVIREGGASMGLSDTMPAWGDSIDPSDIRGLRQLIRGFGAKK